MYPEIVRRALVHTVTDIGQLTPADKRTLEAHVKRGVLSKGKGGPFPTPKTVYAHPGFDFDSDRTEQINQILRIANMETK